MAQSLSRSFIPIAPTTDNPIVTRIHGRIPQSETKLVTAGTHLNPIHSFSSRNAWIATCIIKVKREATNVVSAQRPHAPSFPLIKVPLPNW